MADYIDVTKIKQTRDFFKPKSEEGSSRKEIYGWLILTGSIAMALIALGVWGLQEHMSPITGNEILNLKEAAKSPPTGPEVTPPPAQNEGFFSKAKAALLGTSENQEKESTIEELTFSSRSVLKSNTLKTQKASANKHSLFY